MQTKLTLTIEQDILEQAKQYAHAHGKSLSQLVANYFKYLVERKPENNITPAIVSQRVKRLGGMIQLAPDFDYKAMLAAEIESKYGR